MPRFDSMPVPTYVVPTFCHQSREVLSILQDNLGARAHSLDYQGKPDRGIFALFMHDSRFAIRSKHGLSSGPSFVRIGTTCADFLPYGIADLPAWGDNACGFIAVRRLSEAEWSETATRVRQYQAFLEMHRVCTRKVRQLAQTKHTFRPDKRERAMTAERRPGW